ncbi:hypothetical protein HNQ91_004951 [Filimonas zeae]|nr:hypothetical protein [Filimonas zeae]
MGSFGFSSYIYIILKNGFVSYNKNKYFSVLVQLIAEKRKLPDFRVDKVILANTLQ